MAATTASLTNLSMTLARPGGGSRFTVSGAISLRVLRNGSRLLPDDTIILKEMRARAAFGMLPPAGGFIMELAGAMSVLKAIIGLPRRLPHRVLTICVLMGAA